MGWDVFISHASEDKESVARPLASILSDAGVSVWLDEDELGLGDSLRQTIDGGLSQSRFGVIILSNAYFSKDWTQRELNALLSLESPRHKVILPILHGIDHKAVLKHSPLLADKLAIDTSRGLKYVALEIMKIVSPSEFPKKRDELMRLLWERRIDAPESARLFNEPEKFSGASIDTYTLVEYLGAGGSGVVFRAKQSGLSRTVALKLFYPIRPPLDKFNALFKRAFRALGALNHPNIVSIVAASQKRIADADVFYLVMEYIQGAPLDEWSLDLSLGSVRALPVRLYEYDEPFAQRLRAAIGLAAALKAAHETRFIDDIGFEARGVLHGDIKPANVLVTYRGEVKLLDFHLIDVQRLLDTKFAPEDILSCDVPSTAAYGTPEFMAPEQEKEGIITVQTDIYSLGVTFRCLFDPKISAVLKYCENHLLHSARRAELNDAKRLERPLPDSIKSLLSQMTEESPHSRPSNMAQVVRALQDTYRSYQEGRL